MNILVLSFYYEPDLCAGSFRTTEFIKKLASHEVNIHILTTMPNRYDSHKADAKSIESYENIVIRRFQIPSHKSGMFSQAYSFAVYFFNVLTYVYQHKYDVVYATSSRLFTAFLGLIVSKWKRVPLYLDIRDLFVDTITDLLPTLISRPLAFCLQFIERATFNHARHINLASPGFSIYFKNRFDCQAYSYFTNGIDEIFLRAQLSETVSKRRKVVTYAGNIGDGQALHILIPSLATLRPDLDFRIVGDGGRKMKLKEMTSQMGNVFIEAACSRQRLLDYYREADFLLVHLNSVPAFDKVLPSKIFEYAALGKPIIAGLSGFAADFVSAEITSAEVFQPCSGEGAALAIEKLDSSARIDRTEFINKFRRDSIMSSLAESVIEVGRQ